MNDVLAGDLIYVFVFFLGGLGFAMVPLTDTDSATFAPSVTVWLAERLTTVGPV